MNISIDTSLRKLRRIIRVAKNAKNKVSNEINELFKDEIAKINYLKLYVEEYFLYDSHENLIKNDGGRLFYYNR